VTYKCLQAQLFFPGSDSRWMLRSVAAWIRSSYEQCLIMIIMA